MKSLNLLQSGLKGAVLLLSLVTISCGKSEDDGSGEMGAGGAGQERGELQSDDFRYRELQDFWVFRDPLGDSSFELVGSGTEDAKLILSVPEGRSHHPWQDNTAARVVQEVGNIDFDVYAKFESGPEQTYQMQGIIVEEGPNDYVRVDISYELGEISLYSGWATAGVDEGEKIAVEVTGDHYLRLKRDGDEFTVFISSDGEDWEELTSFEHSIDAEAVGVFAANAGNPAPAFSSEVDFFFKTDDPIEPEDALLCDEGEVFALDVEIEGGGEVAIDPEKDEYECGDVVTLVATPDDGHHFAGYEGYVESAAATIELQLTEDVELRAVFPEGNPGFANDDFHLPFLSDFWTVEDPLGDSHVEFIGSGTDDASFSVYIPLFVPHDLLSENEAFRILQDVDDVDFDVNAKFDSVLSETYQIHGFLFEDADGNFVRFDYHFENGKTKSFAGVNVDAGTSGEGVDVDLGESQYLRVRREGTTWTGFTSEDGETWEELRTFDHEMTMTRGGIFVGTSGESGLVAPHEVRVDYFQNTEIPLREEDPEEELPPCRPGEMFEVQAIALGPGSVSVEPSGPVECGDEVTVSASANPAAEFAGFSGDVSSMDEEHTVAITRHSSILASFVDPPPATEIVFVDPVATDTTLELEFSTDEDTTAVLSWGTTPADLSESETIDVAATSHVFALSDLVELTPYFFRLSVENGSGDVTSTELFSLATTDANLSDLPIDLHYEEVLSVGQMGQAQWGLNIFGESFPLDSLQYSINGGDWLDAGFSPDASPRLVEYGDFNLEVPWMDLQEGLNVVTVWAQSGMAQAVRAVVVDFADTGAWPLPYIADWSSPAVRKVSDVAQVVDGEWGLTEDGLRTTEIGYDRLVAIGDDSWTEYEVLLSFTPHSIGDEGQQPIIGFITRWPGHYFEVDKPNQQPREGWKNLGTMLSIGWASIAQGYSYWRPGGGIPVRDPVGPPEFDVTYMARFRTEAMENGQIWTGLRTWPVGEMEPTDWNIQGTSGDDPMPPEGGAFLIVAHYLDVTIGNVEIRPL